MFFVSVAVVAALALFKFFYNHSFNLCKHRTKPVTESGFQLNIVDCRNRNEKKTKKILSTKSSVDPFTALNFGLF